MLQLPHGLRHRLHQQKPSGIWLAKKRRYGPYILCDEKDLIALPDELTYKDGASVSCGFGTVYEAIEKIGVSGDDAVLVVGLGPVGMAALMLCRAMGAEKLIGVEMNEYRIKMVQDMGLVDHIVRPSDNAVEEIRALTGGHGVERAIDCSASDAGRQIAIRATKDWGESRSCRRGELSDHQSQPGHDARTENRLRLMGHLNLEDDGTG